ncbi:hypothetical protein M758_12G181500 [Ceratodon purpureus]|nr:hypothetical protein M758_12G181500 [Ceratodon purpureus]
MLLDAEKKGLITPGKSTLIELTSGNTGIALAMAAKQRGYNVILIMPQYYSLERRILFRALGAEVVITEPEWGLPKVLKCLTELLKKTPHSHCLNQFSNPANPGAHFNTTGPEIWEGTAGEVDIIVAGIGTGGTITGAGRYLKSKNRSIQVVGVEPLESAVISGGEPGHHLIQGLGGGFVPDVLDVKLLDRVVLVSSQEALAMARRLHAEEGLLVGISSGATFAAALKLAKEPENAGKLIVVVLASAAERYLSTALFETLKKECETMPCYRSYL